VVDLEIVSAYRKIMRLGIGQGLDASVIPIDPAVGEAVGVRLDMFSRKLANQLEHSVFNSPDIRAKVQDKVRDWMEREGSVKLSDLASELEPLLGGVRALMIARTETGWAYNAAAAYSYQAAGFTHVRWMSSPLACEICLALDDQVFEIEDYAAEAIAHPNCSCSSEPIEELMGNEEPSEEPQQEEE
jgi:hypothetical protein